MIERRTIEETTEIARARRTILPTYDDLKWIRRRRRDLIIRWIAYILCWYYYFAVFAFAGVIINFIRFGPIVILMAVIEESVEMWYRKKHPRIYKWTSNSSHFEDWDAEADIHRNYSQSEQ
ncbi:hypothetical protein [Lacticaseibacillus yichunensis]|uniref:Uncharacterized protein n=1 Tax=Lacticaseibacillus yichunensis TaxID=2486015 RepID=A0ABW4CL17_9LACO|nr:hypothetical protein [Lacticaseibacillus yichunensis]